MRVFDSSALLAYLWDENGADTVAQALTDGGHISAVNWSEVAQKVTGHHADWDLTRGVLGSFALTIEPATTADAETAASLWRSGSGLSLADRFCLALASRLRLPVLTADRAWGGREGVDLIR